MAKYARVAPEKHRVFIETNQKNKMFTLFEITPRVVGQVQLQGLKTWVTDDGLTFSDPESVEKYMLAQEAREPPTIAPGEYSVQLRSVTQSANKLTIKVRSGEDIVIHLK